MRCADQWVDYALLDCGDGQKLERWGDIVLCRPDPQAVWPAADPARWQLADAQYMRSDTGGGSWQYARSLPTQWQVRYGEWAFIVRPTGFKHTGLFPEQAVNWDYIAARARARSGIDILNLFGYTGAATVAAAKAGARVCHVDAARGMVTWAKDNLTLNQCSTARWIVDDAVKFVEREVRRGRRYDAIIMDPPSYGRGPDGEVWKIEDMLYGLVDQCAALMSDRPYFFLLNSYTTGLSPTVINNILSLTLVKRLGGTATAEEIGLPVEASGLLLPCGTTGRWEA